MHAASGLIALALGYLVYTYASKEKEGLKILGQIIGITVMILAVLTTVCSAMKCMSKYGCPMMSKANCSVASKINCPVSGADSSQ